jgi:hypothetical protein
MRVVIYWLFYSLMAAILAAALPLQAQQPPDAFRWIDFHSAQAQDQDVAVWVKRSLAAEKWTAIREIGVEYDAALVVTTLRPTPQSPPNADSFTVWYASLTSHVVAPLLKGSNLRLLDWMPLADGRPPELGALYDDCNECAASKFFTAFYYDQPHHMWNTRWMSGGQGALVWSANPPEGVALTQVYAVLNELNGRQVLGTWSHFDDGRSRTAGDVVYRYDLDPYSNLERTQLLSGKEAEAMKQQLCGAQNAAPDEELGLDRGQDSALCQQMPRPRFERRPITTPPAHNQGRSVPPGARR